MQICIVAGSHVIISSAPLLCASITRALAPPSVSGRLGRAPGAGERPAAPQKRPAAINQDSRPTLTPLMNPRDAGYRVMVTSGARSASLARSASSRGRGHEWRAASRECDHTARAPGAPGERAEPAGGSTACAEPAARRKSKHGAQIGAEAASARPEVGAIHKSAYIMHTCVPPSKVAHQKCHTRRLVSNNVAPATAWRRRGVRY